MARNLREVIAAVPADRRAKIAAAQTQKLIAEERRLIAEEKMRQLEEAKRVMELDHKLIEITVLVIALPIIAALAGMAYRPGCGPPIIRIARYSWGAATPAASRYSRRNPPARSIFGQFAMRRVPRPGKDSRGFPVPIRPGHDPHPARQKPIGLFVSKTLR